MPSILVVDDANFIRTMLRRGLEKVGFQVEEAASGWEAEELLELKNGAIDLVICDISMPGQDGIATLRNLKRDYPEMPVVMLTAYPNKDNVIQCAKIGIAGFLVKPLDIKKVRAKICEFLKVELSEVGSSSSAEEEE